MISIKVVRVEFLYEKPPACSLPCKWHEDTWEYPVGMAKSARHGKATPILSVGNCSWNKLSRIRPWLVSEGTSWFAPKQTQWKTTSTKINNLHDCKSWSFACGRTYNDVYWQTSLIKVEAKYFCLIWECSKTV